MSLPVVLMAAVMVGSPLMGDVGGYLERSSEAEFRGEQLVSCDTPDGERRSVFQLAQVDGGAVAWEEGEEAPIVGVAPGLSVTVTGEVVESSVVEGSQVVSPDRYSVEEREEGSYLGRRTEDVSLLRDDVERVRLTVDAATDAVLRTLTYRADGSLYCDRRLLSFDQDVSRVPEVIAGGDSQPMAPMDTDPDSLPRSVEGFELVDTYSLDDDTLSYYSDGFFSVGVAITSRPISLSAPEEVVDFETDDGRYRRSYQAGSVTVTWEADEGNLVLIGDVPPDLVDAFLAELPPPSQEGFFGRIWSRLFG
ncbi:MAG: hypothetical protein ACLFWM_08020 [Actinomycetota bacterium]